MGIIKKLSSELVSQIKAGEVVERPASVLKELIENSIDAGADRIVVEYLEGGIDFLRVVDNGKGMSEEDLSLSVLQSTTSKISKFDDLTRLGSFGFRGEALAATGSVSKLRVLSCQKGSSLGFQMDVEGGAAAGPFSAGVREGTTIEMRDLFFNTPVRRKFLKSARSESAALMKVMHRYSLIYENIAFEVYSQGKNKLRFQAGEDRIYRYQKLYDQKLNIFECESHGIGIKAGLGAPHENHATQNRLFFYINGRYIKDRGLSQALNRAYEGMMAGGRFPAAIVDIDMDPSEVDFNVHPQKLEVRFREPGKLIGTLINRLREFLASSPWQTEGQCNTFNPGNPQENLNIFKKQRSSHFNAFEELSKMDFTKSDSGSFASNSPSPPPSFINSGQSHSLIPPRQEFSRPLPVDEESEKRRFFQDLEFLGQLYKTYILLSHPDRGLFILDQHAAHEKVVFIKLRQSIDQEMGIKKLLFPLSMQLEEELFAAWSHHKDWLEQNAFLIETFGEGRIIVRGIPEILSAESARKLVIDVLSQLSQYGTETALQHKISDICATMACHNSIRAGHEITEEEVKALLKEMDQIDFAANCPHGRPVIKQFDKIELEKIFHRT